METKMDNKDNKKVNVDVMKNIEKIKDREGAFSLLIFCCPYFFATFNVST